MTRTNPYVGVGQIAIGKRFVSRPQLLSQIEDSWSGSRPGNLSIRGNFRVGKSSLARNARVPDGVGSVLVNGGRVDDGTSLVRLLTRRVYEAAQREPSVADCLEGASKMLNWVFDSESWTDVTEGSLDFLTHVSAHGLVVVVVVDEFDRLGTTCGVPALQFLRDIGSEPEFGVGLTAISRRALHEVEGAGSGGSNLSGVFGHSAMVGLLSDSEIDGMIAIGEEAGFATANCADEVRAVGGAHAFLLEMALFHACELMNSSETPTVGAIARRVRQGYAPLAMQYAEVARESFDGELEEYFDGVLGDGSLAGHPSVERLLESAYLRVCDDGTVDGLSPFFVGMLVEAVQSRRQ